MRSFFTGPRPTVIASVIRRLERDGYEIAGCPRQPNPYTHEPGFVAFTKKGYSDGVQAVVKVWETVRHYDNELVQSIADGQLAMDIEKAERELDRACQNSGTTSPPEGDF